MSKTALNNYAVHLAHEPRDAAIRVNAVHQGSVTNDIHGSGQIPVEIGGKP